MVGSRLRCVRQREMYKWGCFARRFSNDIEGASTTVLPHDFPKLSFSDAATFTFARNVYAEHRRNFLEVQVYR